MPRVKAEHEPYRLRDGTVRIGGGIYGIAGEIEDPEGWVWAILRAMDGTRPIDSVVDQVCASFPSLSREDALGLVDDLVHSGYIEDAAAPTPVELTDRERDRYSRSQAYFRWVDLNPRPHGWVPQLRLKEARVLVVGVGGGGATAAWALAASGVGRLHLVDDDLVELTNLNRQVLYTEADVGRPKVTVAVDRLQAVNTDVEITGERRRVASQAELADLVADFDVLALCADEPRGPESIRVWANRACAELGRPWVGGGYNGSLVTVHVFVPGGGACYECATAAAAEQLDRQAPRHPDSPDAVLRLGGAGVVAPSAGIAGHLTAHAVMTLVTGVPEVDGNASYALNLAAPDGDLAAPPPTESKARRPDCPVCGA